MRLRKKILGLCIIIFGIGAFSSFTGIPVISDVNAQASVIDDKGTSTQQQATSQKESTLEDNFRSLADVLLKMVYIMLRPLIILGGLALDNTLVYGQIFHMDAPLWDFWNICKNFANFGLGFMVLYEIIKSIFTLGGIAKPKEVIQKAIIAGIAIQMSWFIVAALIDVSTIMTYGVGGMPMSVLKTNKNNLNQKILQANVEINLNNEKKFNSKDFKIAYQVKTAENKEVFLSPCLPPQKDATNTYYIKGRLYGDEKFRNQGKLGANYDAKLNACVLNGTDVIFYNEIPDIVNLTGTTFDDKITEITTLETSRDGLEACGYVIRLTGTGTTKTCATSSFTADSEKVQAETRYNNPEKVIPKINEGKQRFEKSAAVTIANVVDKSKGFVGALATIYTSLMDFAQLSDISSSNGTLDRGLGEVVLRTGIALLLIIPLLALTVVLIIRVGFLRCIIATSPIIALITAFDLKIGKLNDQINIGNIMKAIFAPVITVFALSMGLIFMTALISTYKDNDTMEAKAALNELGIIHTTGKDGDLDSVEIFGRTIKYPKKRNTYAGNTGDWFSWIIISFSGMGIMRFILFAAINASGTIGAVGGKIKDIGGNMLSTIPIMNLPGIEGKVGIGTLGKEIFGSNSQENLTKMRENSKFVNMQGQNETITEALKQFDEPSVGNTPEANKRTIELLQTKEKNNYKEAGDIVTGKGKSTSAEIMASLGTNAAVTKFIKDLTEDSERDEILDTRGIKEERYAKTKKEKEKETAVKDFEDILKIPTTVDEAKTRLADPKADILAKITPEYTKDIIIENKKYNIKVENTSKKLKLYDDKGTLIQ